AASSAVFFISILAVASITALVVISFFPTRGTYGTTTTTAVAAVASQQAPFKKVLIVTTSNNVLGKTGYPTGVWLPEMTHPFSALQNAGFNITVASVNGGNVPIDPYSIPSNPQGTNRDDPITDKFLHTPADVAIINHTVPLSTTNPKEYSAVVFQGGNGATYDFPWDKNVNRIAG